MTSIATSTPLPPIDPMGSAPQPQGDTSTPPSTPEAATAPAPIADALDGADMASSPVATVVQPHERMTPPDARSKAESALAEFEEAKGVGEFRITDEVTVDVGYPAQWGKLDNGGTVDKALDALDAYVTGGTRDKPVSIRDFVDANFRTEGNLPGGVSGGDQRAALDQLVEQLNAAYDIR